jgi:hypothetical protein
MHVFTVQASATAISVALLTAVPAAATPFSFSTGSPDGLIATLSRPASLGKLETETADDFALTNLTRLTQATLFGLIPSGTPLSAISRVEIEFYHVFPADSDLTRTSGPPTFSTVQVPTRVNSPADVEITSATRDSAAGTLSFTPSLVSSSFSVANTVVNGIHGLNAGGPFTGGEGGTAGEEVLITVNFTTPVDLPTDRYFFRPEVDLGSTGDFLWLSATKLPAPDLQSWIRNDDGLAPDWLRIGTDITHQAPFDAAFSLSGDVIPEPDSVALLGAALAGMGLLGWRLGRSNQSSARALT